MPRVVEALGTVAKGTAVYRCMNVHLTPGGVNYEKGSNVGTPFGDVPKAWDLNYLREGSQITETMREFIWTCPECGNKNREKK